MLEHLIYSVGLPDQIRVAFLLVELCHKSLGNLYILASFDKLELPFAVSLEMPDMIALGRKLAATQIAELLDCVDIIGIFAVLFYVELIPVDWFKFLHCLRCESAHHQPLSARVCVGAQLFDYRLHVTAAFRICKYISVLRHSYDHTLSHERNFRLICAPPNV